MGGSHFTKIKNVLGQFKKTTIIMNNITLHKNMCHEATWDFQILDINCDSIHYSLSRNCELLSSKVETYQDHN